MSQVVLLGFDACDAGTVEHLARQGELPAFAKLLERSRRLAVENPFGVFVSAVWPTFVTGTSPSSHRYTCWSRVNPETYEYEFTHPSSVAGRPFWERVAASGRQVAVMDVPHSLVRPFGGAQVAEWGAHDRHEGFGTDPPELAEEIVRRFGLHPVFGIDATASRQFAPDDWAHRAGGVRTGDEDRLLRADLLAGLERKHELSRWLLGSRDWDLFISVFGESHGGGHQLWHHHDPDHVRHDPSWAADHGDPLLDIYRGLDATLGEHLAAVDRSATVVVLLSHGMGPHYDGLHVLEELLRRLDVHVARHGRRRGSGVLQRAWRALPDPARATAGRAAAAAGRAARSRLGLATSWVPVGAEERARQRWFSEPNNTVCGGVRLNVAGREPRGVVAPEDVERVREQLRRDLLDVVDVDSGRPFIRDVVTVEAHYERWDGDALPDLLLVWDRSSLVETVWSPKVGLLHAPYGLWRSGDHHERGLALLSGPGLTVGDGGSIRMQELGLAVERLSLTGHFDADDRAPAS